MNSSLNSLCLNIYLKLICGGDPRRPPSAARSLGICPWLPQKGPNFCNFLMPKQRSGTAAQPRAHYRRGQQSYLERDPTWTPHGIHMAFMRAKREKTCENARGLINTAPAPMAPSLVDYANGCRYFQNLILTWVISGN